MRARLTGWRGRLARATLTALLATGPSLALSSPSLATAQTPAPLAQVTRALPSVSAVTDVVRGALSVPGSLPLPAVPAPPALPTGPVGTAPPAPGVPSAPVPAVSAEPPAPAAPVASAVANAVNAAPRQPSGAATGTRGNGQSPRASTGVSFARAGQSPAYRGAGPAPSGGARPAPAATPSARRRAPRPAANPARPALQRTARTPPSRAAARPRTTASRPLGAIAAAITNPLKLLPVPDWSKPIIVALLVLALGAAIRARWNTRVARRLRRRGEALWRDLQSLQGALVPDLAPEVGTLAVSAAYCPADGPGAGGDFYDVFERRDGQVAIVLGDVSGHGRQALTRAASMRYAVRAYLQAGLSARDALALAGEAMLERGGERFTTVAVGLYDPAAGTLSYATAGHAPPLLTGTPMGQLVTTCSSPPIGLGLPTGRRETIVSMPAGSAACFFSDGLSEARTHEGMLGRESLASMLAQLGAEPQAPALLGAVREASLNNRDDMAVCIVRARSGAALDVCCEVIELDAVQLASPKVDQFLQACGASHEASFQAITEAQSVAAIRGTAVLHVDRGHDPVQITVAWPHSPVLSVHAGVLPALNADAEGSNAGPATDPRGVPPLPPAPELALAPPA